MAEGVISRAAVKRVIGSVGVGAGAGAGAAAKGAGDSREAFISLDQFMSIVVGLQKIIKEHDSASAGDGAGSSRASEQEHELQVFMDDHAAMQAENMQSATTTASAADADHELNHAAAKDVFDELASGTPFLSPSAFLEWDHVAAMVEEGIIDRARLVQLAGTTPLDWDAFYALVQTVDAIVEAGLVGGEGEDMQGDMDIDGVLRDPGTYQDQDQDHDHDQDDYEENNLQVNDEYLLAVEEVFDELRGKDAKVMQKDKETRNLQETV